MTSKAKDTGLFMPVSTAVPVGVVRPESKISDGTCTRRAGRPRRATVQGIFSSIPVLRSDSLFMTSRLAA